MLCRDETVATAVLARCFYDHDDDDDVVDDDNDDDDERGDQRIDARLRLNLHGQVRPWNLSQMPG